MSLSFAQKQSVVDQVSAVISGAQVGVLAEYRGLTVAQLTALRQQARNQGVWIKVVKNTLAKRVIADSDFACLAEYFTGPVIFAVAEEAVAVAKIMSEFAKQNEALVITAGAMNGKLIDAQMITALAKLPSRDQLLANLVGTLRAPIQQLATVLHQIPSGLVRVLSNLAEANTVAAKPANNAA